MKISKFTRAKWSYRRFMKVHYKMESSLLIEKDMKGNPVFIAFVGSNYIRIENKEVFQVSPDESTNIIVNYIKSKHPEYFL